MGFRAVSATFEGKFGSDDEEWRILKLPLRGMERRFGKGIDLYESWNVSFTLAC